VGFPKKKEKELLLVRSDEPRQKSNYLPPDLAMPTPPTSDPTDLDEDSSEENGPPSQLYNPGDLAQVPLDPPLDEPPPPPNILVKCLYDFWPEGPGEMALRVGDVVQVTGEFNDWWKGVMNGMTGWFPKSYVEQCNQPFILKPSPPTSMSHRKSPVSLSVIKPLPIPIRKDANVPRKGLPPVPNTKGSATMLPYEPLQAKRSPPPIPTKKTPQVTLKKLDVLKKAPLFPFTQRPPPPGFVQPPVT